MTDFSGDLSKEDVEKVKLIFKDFKRVCDEGSKKAQEFTKEKNIRSQWGGTELFMGYIINQLAQLNLDLHKV